MRTGTVAPPTGVINAGRRLSSPPGLLAEVDAEHRLGDNLACEKGVGRVEAAASRVAEQPLQFVGADSMGRGPSTISHRSRDNSGALSLRAKRSNLDGNFSIPGG